MTIKKNGKKQVVNKAMAEDEVTQQSESPLFSDFERIGALLTDAQELSKKNRNYNPAVFREYFVVLAEIQRFLYPLFGDSVNMLKIKSDIEELDKITRVANQKLLTQKDYKVPSGIFEALSVLHQDILILKQNANLGIRVRERLSSTKKLQRSLE